MLLLKRANEMSLLPTTRGRVPTVRSEQNAPRFQRSGVSMAATEAAQGPIHEGELRTRARTFFADPMQNRSPAAAWNAQVPQQAVSSLARLTSSTKICSAGAAGPENAEA